MWLFINGTQVCLGQSFSETLFADHHICSHDTTLIIWFSQNLFRRLLHVQIGQTTCFFCMLWDCNCAEEFFFLVFAKVEPSLSDCQLRHHLEMAMHANGVI